MFEVGNIVRVKNKELIFCICQIEHNKDNRKTHYGIYPVDFHFPTIYVGEEKLEKIKLTREEYNKLLKQRKTETDFNNYDSIHAYNEFARIMNKCIVED